MIRSAEPDDASAICSIYNHYVEETTVTFEEQPVLEEEMRSRIADVASSLPWLVSEADGTLTGYAYASPWKSRCSYRFSVESTIYLAPQMARQGLGSQLYGALISDLRNRPIHAVIGAIALPNPASVALHEKLGFEKVAHFREVGWKFDQWIDVGYWELVLDSR